MPTNDQVPLAELTARMQRFRAAMDAASPDWELVVIVSKVNLYYFTGTMPEGMLLVPRDAEAVLWVRRSGERAAAESLFPNLRPMESYRDAAASFKKLPASAHLETEIMPLAMYQRLQKYFPFQKARSADLAIRVVRAVKSAYELALMEQSGAVHRRVLEERVPSLLRPGMSEAELCAELFGVMLAEGHQGLCRFAMFDTEIVVGQIGFGTSSLYPTSFNGPGGGLGMCPGVPLVGSRERKLAKGDLVFIDVGCGVQGYHTDKTMTYVFGQAAPAAAIQAHQQCVAIQNQLAAQLKPGAIPSRLYQDTMAALPAEFLENFMGFGSRRVKFLGHGIGLQIDEIPVIAEGFDEPLQENMVLAVEPKKGVPNFGLVGIENTFAVTPQGGRCLTGTHPGLLVV